MTTYYNNLKPGGYTNILNNRGAPTQTTTPVQNDRGWALPTTPAVPGNDRGRTQPVGNYSSVLGAPTQPAQPTPIQGHPTANPAAGASAAAQQAGQAQQMAQGQAMAGASANPVLPASTQGHPTVNPAASASAAAQKAGQSQQMAQGNAMAGASNTAAILSQPGIQTQPSQDLSKLSAQPELTDAGKLYNDYVTGVLNGSRPIAGVDSARVGADRSNALNYSHTLQQAQESAAQAGLKPGTDGYNRIIQEALAGVSSQNLDRTNSVNQLQRQAYQDVLGLGKGVEDTAYGRATDQRTYLTNQDNTAYNRGVDTRNYNTERADIAYNRSKTDSLQGKTDQLAAINSIEDPKARQAAMNAYLASQSGNSTYGAILGMYNPDGSLKPEYQSQNPAQGDYQQRIAELKAYYPTKTDAEIQAMAQQEREQERTATRAPIDEATSGAEQTKILEKIRLGEPLTPEEKKSAAAKGTIPEFTAANMPVNDADPAFKELVGKPVNIGGKIYTVVESIAPRTGYGTTTAQARHTDVAVVKDENGNTKYIWGGKVNDNPPKEVSAPHLTPFGF